MADYFTRFSLVVKLAPTQIGYALDLAAKASSCRFEPESKPTDFPNALSDVLEDWSFEVEQDPEGIWINSEYGGIDAACAFIQHLLQKFDEKGRVTFEWSHDCTKPRLDAYGGGAAVITAQVIKTMSTSGWLQSVEVQSQIQQPI